jgi:hypothetical protein
LGYSQESHAAHNRSSRRSPTTGLCGEAVGILLRDQQLAQHVKVAAQDAQLHVSVEAPLTAVATAGQAVACLQRADGRLDARMPLAGLAKGDAGLRLLLPGLRIASRSLGWL